MLTFLDKLPFGTPRLRRILFWLAATFAAYVILGFLAFPPLIEALVENEATTALNRPTSIERVTFNPLTLRFEVHGLKVAKREGEGDLFSVGLLSAAPGISTLWQLAPVVSHLHLRDLVLDITFYGDGRYSVSDLIGARQQGTDGDDDESGAVFPFALYGFEMTNSTIVFDDRTHDKRHVISDIDLLVPFTSSFTDLRKEFTQPRFTAVVNGDPIELKGRTLPFDESLRTEFELGAVDVDLHQYWRYLPVETPLTLVSGRFTSALTLNFERPDAQRVNLFLGGGGKLLDLEVAAPDQGTVLSLKQLQFEMEKYSLGDNELVFDSVALDTPYFKVARGKDQSVNWAAYFRSEATGDEETGGSDERAAPLQVDLRDVRVTDGSLDWEDQALPGGFTRRFAGLSFHGTDISTRNGARSRFQLGLDDTMQVKASGETSLDPLAGNATVSVSGLGLTEFKPYLAQALPLHVNSGTVALSCTLDFDTTADTPVSDIRQTDLEVTGLALRKPDADKASLSLDKLSVSGAAVDLKGQVVTVDRVSLDKPDAVLVREPSGSLDLATLFAEDHPATDKAPATEPSAPAPPDQTEETGWTGTVGSVRVTQGAFRFRDEGLANPTTIGLRGIDLTVDNLTTRQDAEISYALTARPGTRGNMDLRGTARLAPLSTRGRLQVRGLGLRPFDGYLGEHTELLFASGTAAVNLAFSYEDGDAPRFSVAGDTLLSSVQFKDSRGDGEFAGVDTLQLDNLRLRNAPYRLSVDEVKLIGPRAAINFDEQGRLNLRRILRLPEPSSTPTADTEQAGSTQTAGADPAPPPEPAEPETPEPTLFDAVRIGKVTMEQGRVIYRDASVTPVFFTELTEMRLSLTDIEQMRDARPKVDFSASIGPTTITANGVLNPVISPIYSDLDVSVGGLEMIQLTPYTLKYLAYPVQKGRLYADVTFRTENNELDADNRFLVEQLELGPKDTRPDAPNVPVKFGLALLQDSSGDLELNLPIKGRLDDPNFHIGGIVFKAITKLFFSALTSPFSIIGSIFGGGGEDLDHVVFEPGRHQLDARAERKLQNTVKALKARPRLKLEVDGVVDPEADPQGLKEAILEHKLKQQKYDELSRAEQAGTTVDAMTIAPDEYEDLLYEAYADEPDEAGVKPTTLFVTDRMPPEFMRSFIMDRIEVTEKDLGELAVRRARTVKRHITEQEPSLEDRVFLTDRRKDAPAKTGVPLHRADLGLR